MLAGDEDRSISFVMPREIGWEIVQMTAELVEESW